MVALVAMVARMAPLVERMVIATGMQVVPAVMGGDDVRTHSCCLFSLAGGKANRIKTSDHNRHVASVSVGARTRVRHNSCENGSIGEREHDVQVSEEVTVNANVKVKLRKCRMVAPIEREMATAIIENETEYERW
jgi:hypothetical protein